jgi:hypothetical protein
MLLTYTKMLASDVISASLVVCSHDLKCNWHAGEGNDPLGKYLVKNINIPRIFQSAHKFVLVLIIMLHQLRLRVVEKSKQTSSGNREKSNYG